MVYLKVEELPSRKCLICGQEYIPIALNQKYCRDCRGAQTKQNNIAFRKKHPQYPNEYRMKHLEEAQDRFRVYSDTRRALGSQCLNRPFPGSDGHHIDMDHIVYIPKELHQSIPHDVQTGKNMERINAIARSYVPAEVWESRQIETLF